mgnify:CR=1 FL=1
MKSSRIVGLVPVVVIATLAGESLAQCPPGGWVSLDAGTNTAVNCLLPMNSDLYAGGSFTSAGGQPINRIARWDGTAWHPVGGGGVNNQVFALASWNGDLIVGGVFTTVDGSPLPNLARWDVDGGGWSALGSGVNATVYALTVWNGDLIAGGAFNMAGGSLVFGIARWNGSAWTPLGSGLIGGANALNVWNGDLIAAGSFPIAGGVTVNNIARWDGTAWHELGTGMNNRVDCLATLSGGDLVAGGNFTSAGGVPVERISRWNGAAWSPMGAGLNSAVKALLPRANGDLIAGGLFTTAGGQQAYYIARWTEVGGSWSPVGIGMSAGVLALAPSPTSPGTFVAGGEFLSAGGTAGPHIARWDGPTAPSVVRQPSSTVGCNGTPAAFSLTASGTAPLTYQWQLQTGPGVWAALGNDPGPLPCGGGAFAFATPPNSAAVSIGVHPCAGVEDYYVRCVVTNACGSATSDPALLSVATECCDPVDFNGDGLFPDVQDITDFLLVFAGGACPTASCGDIDFNNDELFPDITDIQSLISVFGGGECT